jgi:hypothetical protein
MLLFYRPKKSCLIRLLAMKLVLQFVYQHHKLKTKGIQMSTIYTTDILDKSAIWKDQDDFVLYQPVTPFLDSHGLVVAQLVHYVDGELETTSYYSRGWAYWNFLDIEGQNFQIANEAMDTERHLFGDIDCTITYASEAVAQIASDTIPHSNPYWQMLVLRLAYGQITNGKEFNDILANSSHTPEQIQRMLDLAAGAILQGTELRLTGLKTI